MESKSILLSNSGKSATAEDSKTEMQMVLSKMMEEKHTYTYKKLVVPMSMRSIYWRFFGFPATDDGDILTKVKVVCILCKTQIAYNRNTSNLRMHLQNKHDQKLLELEATNPPQRQVFLQGFEIERITAVVVATSRTELLTALTNRGLTLVPYLLHTLQVWAQACFENLEVASILSKCKVAIGAIISHPAASAALSMQEQLLELEENTMLMDYPPVWTSTYNMLEQIVLRRNIVTSMLESMEGVDQVIILIKAVFLIHNTIHFCLLADTL
ncbi:Zinc finger BED domain-containing protein 1 [Dufourea novaeangliae]|uniref:Zinc finger BED domain-containing protein 1 n=1 Tax=Dufourea novaeangliae TaxID=178035 RepID=A0A154PT25_DUFNO|nr:Zinc finger BED domain-containing protein 1 [Dufourea novaeangliae]